MISPMISLATQSGSNAPLSVEATRQKLVGKARYILKFYLNEICLLILSKLLTSAKTGCPWADLLSLIGRDF